MTSTIRIDAIGATEAAARARVVLAGGGVVAFPTETVYGLAVRGGDQAAIARLYRLKGRGEEKPVARYVSGPDAVRRAEVHLPASATKLMRAFWPGPLTMVVESDRGTTGYRCSSHPFVVELVRDDELAVVGTSANQSGQPPLASAAAIAEVFGPQIDLIVADDGATAGLASTVVQVAPDGGVRTLREGGISAAQISSELVTRVLFVCTGNTCRSPLAEALLRQALERRVPEPGRAPVACLSAGVQALDGMPASENSVRIAAERGLDLGSHRARSVTADLLDRVDRIYALTRSHRDELLDAFPACADRVQLIAGPNGPDVADPVGGDIETYRACADEIARHLERIEETL